MRIAIVCPYYPWPPSVGGVETIVRDVAIELARRGHEVHVATTRFDVTTQRQVTGYGVEERDGVVIHKLESASLKIGYARFLRGLKNVLMSINPDIVHSHCLHPHLFQLCKFKPRLKYKLIAELHHPVVALEKLSAKIVFPIAFNYLKTKSACIDYFIAHTDIERQWLEEKGIDQNKIAIVRLPAISSKLLAYPTVPLRNKNILFLGRITEVKGVHILIEAFTHIKRKYPETKLILAGPSDKRYEKTLRMIMEKYNLTDSIEFTGPVYGENKINLIRSALVFVLPSLKEYTGGVLLEAQALGTPVVATRVGAIPEIVLDGETGFLVEPNNPRELAEAIIRLIEDEELWRRLSTKAREWARNFTLEKRVDELESLYREVLNRD